MANLVRKESTHVDGSFNSPTPSTASVECPFTNPNYSFLPSSPLDGTFRAFNLNELSLLDEPSTGIMTPTLPASDGTFSSHDSLSPETSSGRSTPSVVDMNTSMNSSVFNSSTNMSTPRQPSYWACTPVYIVPGQEWHDFGPVHKMLPGTLLPMKYVFLKPSINGKRLDFSELIAWIFSSLNEKQSAAEDNTAHSPTSVNTTPRAESTILTAMDASILPTDISMPLTPDAISHSATDITMRSGDTTIKYTPNGTGAEGGSDGHEMEVDETEDEDEDEDELEDDNAIFGPLEIQQYAKSCHPFKEGEKTLGLPHVVYTAWNAAPYDHRWMENAEITDKGILNAFTSKLKMDQLLSKGALSIGFELYIETKVTGKASAVEKMARVVGFESGTAYNTKSQKEYKKRLPDLELFVDSIKKSEFKRCDGPKDLLKTLNDLEPKPMPSKGKNPDLGAWKGLQVRHKNGTELGSLYDVRQTYHRWEIEMDAWSAVTGIHTRNRRPYQPATVESVVDSDDE
ncbi:MAG: hypothetical protein Q9184_006068 [Pyrenodesmia sp. 2 TL-2023]